MKGRGAKFQSNVLKEEHSAINPKPQPVGQQGKEVARFVLDVPTTIILISLSGEKKEKKLPSRIKSYKDLQREICSLTKNSNFIYTIRDSNNIPILSSHFKTYDEIRVKEIGIKGDMALLSNLSSTWERDTYGKVIVTNDSLKVSNATGISYGKNTKKKDDDDWD